MRSQEQAKSTWTCQKSHFVWKFTGKNAHGHVRRAILCGNLQEKRHRHRSQEPFCGFRGPRFGWKLRHMLQEPFCMEIYRKSAGPGFRGRHFVWKFIGKNAFCVEIYKKNAGGYFHGPHFVWKFTGKNAHGHCTRAILCGNLQEKCRKPPSPPGPTRAPFYSYRKNPFSVATLFGEKLKCVA